MLNNFSNNNLDSCKDDNCCKDGSCIKGGLPVKKEWTSFFAIFFLVTTLVFAVLFINQKREIWLQSSQDSNGALNAGSGKSNYDKSAKKSYSLAKQKVIEEYMKLPEPKKTGSMAVEEAINNRRSRREFEDKAITLQQLSQVLWSAQGITEAPNKRTAPSAREIYPYTLYIVVRNVDGLKEGLYEYDPIGNRLGYLGIANAGEMLNSANVQPNSQTAPVVIVMSAVIGKAVEKFPDNPESVVMLEGGHIGQNIYLQIEAMGLGTVVTAGFDFTKVREALKLDDAETPVYLIPFGVPKKLEPTAKAGEETSKE